MGKTETACQALVVEFRPVENHVCLSQLAMRRSICWLTIKIDDFTNQLGGQELVGHKPETMLACSELLTS